MATPYGGTPGTEDAGQLTPVATRPAGLRRRWRRYPFKVVVGFGLLTLFVLMAIIGPFVAPYDPTAIGPDVLAAPSAAHLLGTTNTGQDVLSQLLVGARVTLLVGFGAGAVATVLSVIVGISAGYYGDAGGELLSMLTNIFLTDGAGRKTSRAMTTGQGLTPVRRPEDAVTAPTGAGR